MREKRARHLARIVLTLGLVSDASTRSLVVVSPHVRLIQRLDHLRVAT
jgi:hypothetical protein